MSEELIPIVFAGDLPKCTQCGEPFCEKHNLHYADCPCLGPSEAEEKGFEVIIINNKLYGKQNENQ